MYLEHPAVFLEQMPPAHDQPDAGAVHEGDAPEIQHEHRRQLLAHGVVDRFADLAHTVVVELAGKRDRQPLRL